MKLRLVAVDMDGTCVAGGHRVPDRNIWALEQAWRAGAVVVPATGRPLSGYPVPLKRLPWIRYVISSNGARLTDRLTGKDLRQALIPAAEAVSLLRALKGTAVWISVHKDGSLAGGRGRRGGKAAGLFPDRGGAPTDDGAFETPAASGLLRIPQPLCGGHSGGRF